MRDEPVSETKFSSMYMEIMGCSEAVARSVYMFISEKSVQRVDPSSMPELDPASAKPSLQGSGLSRN